MDLESARTFASLAMAAIDAGRMPPWPASAECRHYEGERLVPVEDREALQAWIDNERAEGDPADYVAPPPVEDPIDALGPPDLVLGPAGGYEPTDGVDDDYHCYVLDQAFEEDAWIRLLDVLPGNDATVHHVIVYRVPAHDVPTLLALDEAEGGEGYTCFGGPGVGTPDNLGGWLPGMPPQPFPEGVALKVEAGSRLVMQVHYNLIVDPGPDPGTRARLWLAPEPPVYRVEVLPLANLAIVIEPHDPESTHTQDFYNTSDRPWVVSGVSAHMHLLGRSISLSHIGADGSESCLLDIPRWEFGWQQPYAFADGHLAVIEPGDRVRMTCTYDNSTANQPAIGRVVGRAPEVVTWGDGTLDEMCLGLLIHVTPRETQTPSPAESCAGFDACYAACRAAGEPLSACAFACPGATASACAPCTLNALSECLAEVCPTEVGVLLGCLQDCYAPGVDTSACLAFGCAEPYADFDACASPLADVGDCDAPAASCGVALTLGGGDPTGASP